MLKKYNLNNLSDIDLNIKIGDIIFLHGDLASGKTTFSKHIINNLFGIKKNVTSPTYNYYNKYEKEKIIIYHFDLYKLSNYNEFFAIGAEEIIDNSDNISIIEWPLIISNYIKPNIEIFFQKTQNEFEREINIFYR